MLKEILEKYEYNVLEQARIINYFKEYFDFCFHEKFRNIAYEIVDTIIEASEQAADDGLKFNKHTYGITMFASRISNIDSEKFRAIVSQVSFNESIEHRPLYILGCLMTAAEDKSCSNSEEQKRDFICAMESIFEIEGEVK